MAHMARLLGMTLISGALACGFGSAAAQDQTQTQTRTSQAPGGQQSGSTMAQGQGTTADPGSKPQQTAGLTCPLTTRSAAGALGGGALGAGIDAVAKKNGIDGLGTLAARLLDARIKGPDTPVECLSIPGATKAPAPAPAASAPAP